MKIRIIAVGKLKRGPLFELIEDYKKRLRRPLQIIEVAASNDLLSYITDSDYVVAMDERGESLSSQQFAGYMDKLQVAGISVISFIIGAAHGLDKVIMDRANNKIAFGIQTWPHMFVRLMLIEQIYRAESILSGHPYHKD